jgi:hypothetical protein
VDPLDPRELVDREVLRVKLVHVELMVRQVLVENRANKERADQMGHLDHVELQESRDYKVLLALQDHRVKVDSVANRDNVVKVVHLDQSEHLV